MFIISAYMAGFALSFPQITSMVDGIRNETKLPLEGVLGFEASVLALLIPIGFFLLDSAKNSETGIAKLDQRVVLENVIEAKKLVAWIVIISAIGVLWYILPIWVTGFVLFVAYGNVFYLIVNSYKWLTSRTVTVNDFERPSSTFQNKSRVDYISNLKNSDEIIETYGLLFKHNGWIALNQTDMMGSYLNTLRSFHDESTKSAIVNLLLNALDGKYPDSTFNFTDVRALSDFLHWLVAEVNRFIEDDMKASTAEERMQLLNISRTQDFRFMLKYLLGSSDERARYLEVLQFDRVFWGNVASLENENLEKMERFLRSYLGDYFDNYQKKNFVSANPSDFKSEWHITFDNIQHSSVSWIIYNQWLERLFDYKTLYTDQPAITNEIKQLTEWLMPDIEYSRLGMNYHILHQLEMYISQLDYLPDDTSKRRFWQTTLMKKNKFEFVPNMMLNVSPFFHGGDVTYKEEQEYVAEMMGRPNVKVDQGKGEADKLSVIRAQTRFMLKNNPKAFLMAREQIENITFEDQYEFVLDENMKASVVDSERYAERLNEQLKSDEGSNDRFIRNKSAFLNGLIRLESVYFEIFKNDLKDSSE